MTAAEETLSPGQAIALRNLGRKRDGEDVPFINIADARSLCELGLAQRSRIGWDLTVSGAGMLARIGPSPGKVVKARR